MKTTFHVRYRWWAKLYAGLSFLLAAVHIYLPIRLTQWVCERSTEYRLGNGKWRPLRVDLAGEAEEIRRESR